MTNWTELSLGKCFLCAQCPKDVRRQFELESIGYKEPLLVSRSLEQFLSQED